MAIRIEDKDIDAASPHMAILAHRSRELAQSKSADDRKTAEHLAERFKDAHAAEKDERKRIDGEDADRTKRVKRENSEQAAHAAN